MYKEKPSADAGGFLFAFFSLPFIQLMRPVIYFS